MTRKTVPLKIRAVLQQDIRSECPFCANKAAAHFQVHHMDGNNSNNDPLNLIMICPNCHSKITKGDIPITDVMEMKARLPINSDEMEFVSVVPSSSQWLVYDENAKAFHTEATDADVLPLYWNFINHTNRTLLLKSL